MIATPRSIPAQNLAWKLAAVIGLSASLSVSGCGPGRSRTITIATPWTVADREPFERAFREWPQSQTLAIQWIDLAPGDDFEPIAGRPDPPDLILGASPQALRRLLAARRLDTPGQDAEVNPPWRVARRWRLGTTQPGNPASQLAFDDFRSDPISLAWAGSILETQGWSNGYAFLVRQGGVNRRPGRVSGSAIAAFERDEVAASLVLTSLSGSSNPQDPPWDEGIALFAGTPAREPARAFLDLLADRGLIGPPPVSEIAKSSAGETLLADLLGATLIDAQDDLWVAANALRLHPDSQRAEHWMGEPPPWPPASVSKLLKGQKGMELVETLARQIAPDPATRAWLLKSWLGPIRLIDGAWLDELGQAVEGGLVREPRFRAWLRSEWTAWARQRYRRVVRLADAAGGLSP